jgi:hypothetical protein
MVIPLSTETGIVPLRVRWFTLALGYLQHLLELPPTHFARAASNSPIKLAATDKKSWAKDLISAASKLPFACPGPNFGNATSKSILDYAKNVDNLMLQWIQSEVDSSDKLYLLQGRREPQKDKPPAPQTPRLRYYLSMVKTQKHREALTSLPISTHLLAVEILRYGDHEHPRQDDHSKRVCRFCKSEIETPEHALLGCDASSEVVHLRSNFLVQLFATTPTLRRLMEESNLTPIEFFKSMV